MITFLLNGVVYYPSDIDGLSTLSITARTNDGVLEREISSELIFRGEAYEYLKSKFIDSATALSNQEIIYIIDDCCPDGYSFVGLIALEGIQFCDGDCEMRVRIVEYNPPFTCFKSTIIFDDWNGFKERTDHPRITYCNELRPNWLMHVLIIFMILWNITLLILTPIVAVISGIISVVCFIINLPFIPGHCPDELSDGILDDFIGLIKKIDENIIGCGRKHPSPLVREYVKNVCAKCGLNFVSSIFNNPASEYYNTVYFNAPIKKGSKTITVPIDANYPLLTCDMMFDQLKPLFAAEYTIRGTDLVFDRRDTLKLSDIVFDFTTVDKYKLQSLVCYSWNGKKKPAYINCQYFNDGVDLVGSEALNLYNDIVDFNVPLNPTFTGHLDKQFEFGTPRFRTDGIEEDVLAFYEHFPIIKSLIQPFDNVLIMAQHTALFPKLMIWDGVDASDARVKIYPTPYGYESLNPQVDVNAPYKLFNYPFYVDADFNSAQKNLWEFQKLEDPRDSTLKNLTFDLTFIYECGDISKLKIWSGIIIGQGTGTIEEYTIDFAKHTVNLKGTL